MKKNKWKLLENFLKLREFNKKNISCKISEQIV